MIERPPTPLEVYRSALLDNDDALAIATSLVEQDLDPAALGLMVEIIDGGRCRLVDPVVRSKGKGKAQDFHVALVGAMQVRLQQGTVRQAYNSATFDTSGLVAFPQAAFALVAHSMPGPASNTPPDDLMLFIPDSPSSAQWIADAMRMGRNGTLLTAKDMQGKAIGSLVRVSDAAEEYGLASSLTGRSDTTGRMRPLARHLAGSRDVWIDASRPAPRPQTLVLLDRYCQMTTYFAEKDFAWVDEGVSRGLLITIERAAEAVPLEALAAQIEPVQAFSLTLLAAMPDAQAALSLAGRIADEGYRLGYRVSLQPVPRGVSAEMDVGPLIEEIEDLKLQIAQINALGAPQMRLLRFTDAQLPAMIDALRRLPPERLRDGSLRYAAGHSAGRAEPAHYLMHDISVAPARVVEALWRGADLVRPMSYWLDPFVAEHRNQTRSETLVFVPDNTFLVPSLAHFGGKIDTTLRLIIGNLFYNIKAFLERPGCRPMFLFTPMDDSHDQMEVEVLDERDFAPLHQSLGWMNDYLQVRSPGLIDRETLRLLAEELYEGDFVSAERKQLETTVAGMSAEWQSASVRIREDAVGLIAAHAGEIELATVQIESAQAWLKQAEAKMRGLETLLRIAAAAMSHSEKMAQSIEDLDARMIRVRQQFEARVANEFERSELGADRYKQRLQRLLESIEALRGGRQ